jgi:sugar diacid utilization regulator
VERLLKENDLFGVYSRPFYRLGDFHYHYAHTLDALKLRFCAQSGRCLVDSEELALYSLIASTREADGPDLPPHPIIRTLQQSDQQRKTAYVETLFAYLAHSQKSLPTCNALHIHRNTLDYRLRRMEELTGLDWGDGDLMFRLYLSLCSLRYDQLALTLPPLS